MKLSEIAEKTFSKIERGEADLEIKGAAGLDLAGEGEIAFLANPKYTPQINTTEASAIFLNEKEKIERDDIAILRAKDPYLAYTRALRLFHPDPEATGFVHLTAIIDETAKIGKNVEIQANVVIGKNCEIAENVKIFPNVTIYENVKIGSNTFVHSGVSIREDTEIGKNCIIHNNCVIGSDGFGYAKTEENRWLKIPQTGRVVIENDVEIGAGTCIDCASVGETRIKHGVKLDNLVQVGHACLIEEDALICGQTGLAGSTHVGKRVVLAGQVGVAGHLKIGDDTIVTSKTGVANDLESGKVISGYPAIENRVWLRSSAVYRRLGDWARRIKKLEKIIDEMSKDLS